MISIDPIRPYLWLAKWIGAALVVAFLFLWGYRHGKADQAEKDAGALHASQAQASALAGRLQTIDAETQAMAKAAADQVKAAKQAEERAAEGAKALRSELAEVNADIAKAKRDPDCRRMMEARTCALLR